MDINELILKLIKEKYKSIRQFSIAADIPYTTVKSGLKSGIRGMAVETVIKMCHALDIQIENLLNTESAPDPNDFRHLTGDESYILQKYKKLSTLSKREMVNYLDYLYHREKSSELDVKNV